MPAPALQSLATRAGKSFKDAERYYSDAKAQVQRTRGKNLKSDDYRLIMGIVKKRLGLPTKPFNASAPEIAANIVEMVMYLNASPEALIESIGLYGDSNIRTFFDSGILHFATSDDVLIAPGVDSRVDAILTIVNEYNWPHDHPLLVMLDGYEGDLTELYTNVLLLAKVIGTPDEFGIEAY